MMLSATIQKITSAAIFILTSPGKTIGGKKITSLGDNFDRAAFPDWLDIRLPLK
jgi:hypothetical protein